MRNNGCCMNNGNRTIRQEVRAKMTLKDGIQGQKAGIKEHLRDSIKTVQWKVPKIYEADPN